MHETLSLCSSQFQNCFGGTDNMQYCNEYINASKTYFFLLQASVIVAVRIILY